MERKEAELMYKWTKIKKYRVLLIGFFGIVLMLSFIIMLAKKQAFMDLIRMDDIYATDTNLYNSNLIKTDVSKEVGSEENPFVVLEVVPYRGYGELGYLVEGSEPVNPMLLANDMENKGKWQFLLNALKYQEECYIITEEDKESEAFSKKYETIFGESPTNEELKNWTFKQDGEVTQNGYFTRVENGMGSYVQTLGNSQYDAVLKGTGDYDANIEYYVSDNGDTGKHYINYFEYNLSGTGIRYDIVGVPVETESGDYDKVLDETYIQNNKGSNIVSFVYDSNKDANKNKPHYSYRSYSYGGYYRWTGSYFENRTLYSSRYYSPVFARDDNGDYIIESVNNSSIYNSSMRYDLFVQEHYTYNKNNGSYNLTFAKNNYGNYSLIESEYSYKNGTYGAILNSNNPFFQTTNGNYKKETDVTYTYVGQGNGNYTWTEDENQPTDYVPNHNVSIGDKIWITNQEVVRGYYYKPGYKNTNILKKIILKSQGVKHPTEKQLTDYHVKVITVTPEELNTSIENDTDKSHDFAEIADMVYISSKTHNSAFVWLYENYSPIGKLEPIKYADSLGSFITGKRLPDFYEHLVDEKSGKFDYNDLSWTTVSKLFKRIATEERVPVIFDYNVYDVNAGDTNWIKNVRNTYYQYSQYNRDYYYDYTNQGNINNASKLFLMCNVMDPGMFYTMYIEPDSETKKAKIEAKKVIIPNKDYEIETGYFNTSPVGNESEDTKLFWNAFTFLPIFNVGTSNTNEEGYSSQEAYWKALGYKSTSNWGNESALGNVFVFNGREVFSNWGYSEPSFYSKENFLEVFDYFNKTSSSSFITVSEVLEYIIQSKKDIIYKKNIKILDLEPCTIQTDSFYQRIGVTSYTKGISGGDYPERSIFTAKDVRKYLNHTYAGEIQIVRQSTAEFNGKIEELSDVYDLIYIGLNSLMYNVQRYYVEGGYRYLPKYNDDDLDGKIYLHVGDAFYDNDNWPSNVNWIGTNSRYVRAPGNDITKLKREKLEAYVNAGYPVLVEKDIYNTGTPVTKTLVDDSSNLYHFVDENKTNNNLISTQDININNKITQKVSLEKPKLIVDKSTPVRYNGVTTTGIIDDKYYLKERALKFVYTIANTHDERLAKTYKAKIYVDINSDGRFADSECIYAGRQIQVEGQTYTIKKNLSSDYVGAIPWKLELINTQNSNIKISEIGISAIKRSEAEKKTIKILQVNQSSRMSNSGSTLNIEKNANFQKYLANLNDYKVDFYNITIEQFEYLRVLENYPNRTHQFDKSTVASKQATDALATNYDMIIFGFANMYDNVNNWYGALDNTKYFIDCGKCVLFTHDVTSFENLNQNAWGYNFNIGFRGILGMDRFGVRNGGNSIDKATYPGGNGHTYREIHGYTNRAVNMFAGGGGNSVSQYKGSALSTNFKETSKVTKVNEGQITQYPYYIPDTINVATTHGQYYQLDMEDSEIVVWYCLASNGTDTGEWYQNTYNDASNNYFIYSKGNVMYSGVGHSTVGNQEDEVKLFINTMIASYQNTLEAPSAEILDETAVKISNTEYLVYTNNNYEDKENYSKGDYQYIPFTPVDNNLLAPNLKVTVQLFDENNMEKTGGEGIKVYYESDDPEHNNMAQPIDLSTQTLVNGETYILRYPKTDLNDSRKGKIVFTITNEKEIEGSMTVNVMERSMFVLD